VAIPYGEDADFDLIFCQGGSLQRVQVKHGTSRDGVLVVRCRTHSLTNGKVKRVKRYTSAMIEWLAVWDSTTDRCFYIPARELGTGRSMLHLRLAPTRNGQVAGTRDAADYTNLDAAEYADVE
jgi:PD-(D/E)XK endonuclease